MKKGKAWAKGQLEYYIKAVGDPFNSRTQGMIDAYKNVEHIINQLDEPEVLSQEFIDEHEQCITGHGADKNGMSQYHHAPFVSVCDLKNLLVPKQNKPIIPKFVANEIERYEDMLDMLSGEYFYRTSEEIDDDGLLVWIDENQDTFARAWLDGYEVEREKRYYIVDKTNNSTLMTFELSDVVGEGVIEFVYGYSENETIHFNSKEKAELIAHFVGESLEVEEVTE